MEINYELIIACLALFLSLWTIISTRKHNRLSVRPKLDFEFKFSNKDNTYCCNLSNNGIGPAIINTKIIISYHGVEYNSVSKMFYDNHRDLWLNDIDWTKNCGSIPEKGYCISAGTNIPLFTVKGKHEKLYDTITTIINKTHFQCGYLDMYDRKFITKSH